MESSTLLDNLGDSLSDLVFQLSLDPIVISTVTEGKILNVNAAFCKIAEYKREEIIGLTGFDLGFWVIPEDRTKLVEILHGCGKVHDFELDFRRRSGEIRRLLVAAEVFELNGEQLILMTAKDISDRKVYERLISESEKAYRLLFENNPNPMWIYDGETLEFLEVNDAAIAQYGYSRAEFQTMTLEGIRPQEDIPALRAAIANTINDPAETIHCEEWRHLKKDGSIFDAEINHHRIIWKDRVAGFVIAKDISDRKRITSRLQEAQRISKISYWEYDLISHKVDWDLELFHLFGCDICCFTPSYESFAKLLHPEDLKIVENAVQQAIAGTNIYPIEYRIICNNGSIYWFEANAKLITDNLGRGIKLLGTVQNISDRKAAERLLHFAQFSIQQSGESIFWVRTDGSFFYVNDMACQTLGYSSDELCTMSVFDIDVEFPPAMWSAVWQEMKNKKA